MAPFPVKPLIPVFPPGEARKKDEPNLVISSKVGCAHYDAATSLPPAKTMMSLHIAIFFMVSDGFIESFGCGPSRCRSPRILFARHYVLASQDKPVNISDD